MSNFACEWCGNIQPKKKSDQRWCSNRCYQKNWEKNNRDYVNARMRAYQKKRREAARTPKTCAGCGNVFSPTHKTSDYCSQKCRMRFYTKSNRKAVNGWRDKYYRKTRVSVPWQFTLMALKSRAKRRGLAFDLDSEWASSRWTGNCELSGIPFVLDGTTRNPFTLSVDKIDPKKGYTKDNCRFILWALNAFKGESDDATMLKIARILVTNTSRTD